MEKREFYLGSNQQLLLLLPPPSSNKAAFVHFMDFYYSKIHNKKYTLKENKWFSHSLQTISTEIFIQY